MFQNSRGRRSNSCFPTPGSIPSTFPWLGHLPGGDFRRLPSASRSFHELTCLGVTLQLPFSISDTPAAICPLHSQQNILGESLSQEPHLRRKTFVCPPIASWFTWPLSINQMPKRRPSPGQRKTPAFLSQVEVGDFPTGNATNVLAVC